MTTNPTNLLLEALAGDGLALSGPDRHGDWYLENSAPVITKAGCRKIDGHLGIEHGPLNPVPVRGPIVAFTASATLQATTVWEVGSCRFDLDTTITTKTGKTIRNPSPEFGFAPEMAAKRLRQRGTIALALGHYGIGGVVYGEDELKHIPSEDEAAPAPKAKAPQPTPAPPAQAPEGSSSPGSSSWRDCVAAVSRMCGIPMDTRFPGTGKYDSDLDQMLLKAHGWFEGDQGRRGVFTHNTHPKGMPTWDKMNALNEKWAGTTLDKLRKTVACLEEGQGITLEYDNYANGKSEWHSVALTPLGQTERPPSGPEDDYGQQPLPEDESIPF